MTNTIPSENEISAFFQGCEFMLRIGRNEMQGKTCRLLEKMQHECTTLELQREKYAQRKNSVLSESQGSFKYSPFIAGKGEPILLKHESPDMKYLKPLQYSIIAIFIFTLTMTYLISLH